MRKVFDYIKKYNMLEIGDRVVVGVSGGADSLCLLLILEEFRKIFPFSLTVVHVEHGIRGEESRKDAEFVQKICRERGICCIAAARDVPAIARERKMTLEEAGRMVRYEFFEEVCGRIGAGKIAVAHNMEDQAETVIANMARGSGLAGGGGIRPVRGKIIRPLLGCSRREIEEYLTEQKVVWRNDRTNEETEYTRNAIRHQVLPLLRERVNPGTVGHLAEFAGEMQKAEAYIRRQAGEAAKEMTVISGGRVQIDISMFSEAEEIIREYIVRECLLNCGCGLRDLNRYHIRQIGHLSEMQSGSEVILPGGWRAGRSFGKIWIGHEKYVPGSETADIRTPVLVVPGEIKIPGARFLVRIFDYKSESIPQKKYTKWLNYDRITSDIFLRTRQPGDFLVVNRDGGTKKLKRYFIEEKIPADLRERMPLVASGREILWIPGYRINEAYKVTPQTKKVIELQMMEDNDGRENQSTDSGGRGRQKNCGTWKKDQ